MLYEADNLQRDGLLEVCLREILRNFMDAGNAPAIEATGERFDNDTTCVKAWGYRRLVRKLGYAQCLGVGVSRAFFILNNAIRNTKFPTTELVFGCEDRGVNPVLFEQMSKTQ